MIANPGIPHPVAVPAGFTLNDLRMHGPNDEESSPTSALSAPSPLVMAVVAAVVLAIGGFFWVDPLGWFTPAAAGPPSLAPAPSAEPARSTEKLEIAAPLTPVPATKSDEVPIAPAAVARAPHVPAPTVRPRVASVKPATPKEETSPVLLTKPEEKTDAPIVTKPGDDAANAVKPAGTE